MSYVSRILNLCTILYIKFYFTKQKHPKGFNGPLQHLVNNFSSYNIPNCYILFLCHNFFTCKRSHFTCLACFHFSILKIYPVCAIKHFHTRNRPHKISTDRCNSIEISREKARQLNILTAPTEPELRPKIKRGKKTAWQTMANHFYAFMQKAHSAPKPNPLYPCSPTCGQLSEKSHQNFLFPSDSFSLFAAVKELTFGIIYVWQPKEGEILNKNTK